MNLATSSRALRMTVVALLAVALAGCSQSGEKGGSTPRASVEAAASDAGVAVRPMNEDERISAAAVAIRFVSGMSKLNPEEMERSKEPLKWEPMTEDTIVPERTQEILAQARGEGSGKEIPTGDYLNLIPTVVGKGTNLAVQMNVETIDGEWLVSLVHPVGASDLDWKVADVTMP